MADKNIHDRIKALEAQVNSLMSTEFHSRREAQRIKETKEDLELICGRATTAFNSMTEKLNELLASHKYVQQVIEGGKRQSQRLLKVESEIHDYTSFLRENMMIVQTAVRDNEALSSKIEWNIYKMIIN